MKRYDLLESMIGEVSSLDAAPIGTREKINAAYGERLSWSEEKVRGYICSPLSAPDNAGILQNMLAARLYSEVASRNLDLVGKAPHAWLPEFLDDHNPTERQIGLDVGIGMLRSADCCIVCGSRVSNGMEAEIELAGRENITVYTFSERSRNLVDEILAGTTKGIRKHTHIEPPVASDLRVLSMTPEEVNALRLDRKDLFLFQDANVVTQDERLIFKQLCGEKLQTLHDYDAYRHQRDAGGDFIPTYERQMLWIEGDLIKKVTAAGLEKDSARLLLADAIRIPRVLGQQDQLTITPTNNQGNNQGKGRGR